MPRPNPVDEQGNPLPHTDFDDYRRLEYLVPGALCKTRSGVITEWLDPRPQPTYDEIDAVTDAEIDAAQVAYEEDNFVVDNATLLTAKIAWNHENRIRALEGQPDVTFRQFVRAVKAL